MVTPAEVVIWPQLSALLDEMLDLDAAARVQRLTALRLQDLAAAEAVEALLGRLTAIDRRGFLAQPAALPEAQQAGQVVGAYRLLRELGRGGMGTVWLAERTDGRFEGRVAIKFLALAFGSRGGAARFAREGNVLARLAHPHIARLLDAGVTLDNGLPYLVLDYVDGTAIDEHCERAALNPVARVELVLAVLGAVAHAHTRLILHRDIKPGNILVTAAGEVKLLDFGIAKLLDDPGDDSTNGAGELTREAGNAYTTLYAAPEQVQGGDVTTATDVYALGVLLHVLLCGLHPGGEGGTPLERMRRLVEDMPQPMSRVLLAARPGDAAATRLARQLRGDLDLIVAKALKPQPAERYANAAQLAEDLRRWRADEAVLARPDGRRYRLRKFVVRHRMGVAAGASVVLALVGGVGVASWQAAEAGRQRVQAEGLIEFMLSDLRQQLQPVGRLDVLDAVGAKALAYYAAQDERAQDVDSLSRRSRALHLMGETAELRGDLPAAAAMFEKAAASTAEMLARSPDDGQRIFDHAQSVYWVGFLAWRQGRPVDAEVAFRRYESLALRIDGMAPNNETWRAELAYAKHNLGTVLTEFGSAQEAWKLLEQARQRWLELLPLRPALAGDLANTLGWLARANERRGRLHEAMAQLSALVTLRASAGGDANAIKDAEAVAAVGTARSQMARVALSLGDALAAERHVRAALVLQQALTAREPANTMWRQEEAWSRLRLAEALLQQQRSAEAREQLARARGILQSLERIDGSVAVWRDRQQGLLRLLTAEAAEPADRDEALQQLAAWAQVTFQLADLERQSIRLRALLLLGDAAAAKDDAAAARMQWRAVADGVMADATPDPMTATQGALAWLRLGDPSRAADLAQRVANTDFRHAAYAATQQRLMGDAAAPSLAMQGVQNGHR